MTAASAIFIATLLGLFETQNKAVRLATDARVEHAQAVIVFHVAQQVALGVQNESRILEAGNHNTRDR